MLVALFSVGCTVLSSLILQENVARAQQWQQLFDASNSISLVRFLPEPENTEPRVGFAATAPINGLKLYSFHLLRTSDGGVTWQEVLSSNIHGRVTDIAFEDSRTGWLATSGDLSSARGVLYKTTDGGLTWTELSLNGQISAIYYHKPTNRLFASMWLDDRGTSFVSTDEGATWNGFATTDLNGITFNDDMNGVATTLQADYWRTTDGGVTWSSVAMNDEVWRGYGFPNSKTVFAASELWDRCARSDDNGMTWKYIYDFLTAGYRITGDMEGNGCTLFIQGANTGTPSIDEKNGVWYSTDQGNAWSFLGGPTNLTDTRMCVVGRNVYAADGFTTLESKPHGVWRYVMPLEAGDRPQFDDTIRVQSPTCENADTTFAVSAQAATCYDAVLTKAWFDDSLSFSLDAKLPFVLTSNDSLHIRYVQVHDTPDTSILHLTFYLGEVPFDTSIVVIGNAVKRITPRLVYANGTSGTRTVQAGDTMVVAVTISANDLLDTAALSFPNSVSAMLAFDTNLVTPASIKAGRGWILTFDSASSNARTFTVVREQDSTLDSVLLTIKFYSTLSINPWSYITLSNIILNNALAPLCFTAPPTDDTLQVFVNSLCSDSLLRSAMRGKPEFEIIAVRPNPTTPEHQPLLSIHTHANAACDVALSIADVSGKVLFSTHRVLVEGESSIPLELPYQLAEGTYILTVESSHAREVRKLVVRGIQ